MSSLLKLSVSACIIFLFSSASGSDTRRLAAGAGEAGTGFACTAKEGFWSSFHNQGLLPLVRSVSAGMAYENRFGLSELGTCSAAVIWPYGKTSMAAIWSRFGYSGLSRSMAGFACGLPVGERTSAGIQIDFFNERYGGEYEANRSVTFEAGMLFEAGKDISIGIHLFNPLPQSFYKSYMPSSLRIAAGAKLAAGLFTGIELGMTSGSGMEARLGCEYQAGKDFMIRCGYCSEGNRFSLGTGFRVRPVQIDLAFTTHQRLGVTSTFSMIFFIGKDP